MAGVLVERVQLIAQAVTTGFSQKVAAIQKSTRNLRREMGEFAGVLIAPQENLKSIQSSLNQTSGNARKNGFAIRNLTTGMKGFRMELLAVLFFGMAVQRMFTGFLKPAMEAFGVFELFRDMLLISFVPVLEEDVLPAMLKLFEVITDLSPETQLLIGRITLLGVAIGFLGFVFATIALGLGGIIGLISAGLLGTIVALTVTIPIALAAIGIIFLGFIRLFKGKWDGLGLIIMGIGIIIALFIAGPLGLLIIAIGAAVFLIINKWDKITVFFKDWFDVFKFWFTSAVDFMSDKFGGVFAILTNPFVDSWNLIKGIIGKIKDSIKSIPGLGNVENISSGVGGFFNRLNPFNDFIIRPGGAPVAFNPSDTIIGVKDVGSLGRGGGGNITVAPVFNIQVTDKFELERIMGEFERKMVEDLKRITKT